MRVAVTGGIGEGKSTVLQILRDLGQATFSADEVAREVFSDDVVQGAISSALNLSLPVRPDELQKSIAQDPVARRAVNAITHPRIVARLLEKTDCFIEVPLLIETVLHPAFDAVWVVTCGPEEQLRRVSERYGDEARARALIRTQLASRAKIPFADQIIRTNSTMASVKAFVSKYLSRAL